MISSGGRAGFDTLRQRNGKPYSATYIRQLNSQLSAIFNYAEKHYGIKPNPTKKVKKTGSAKSTEMQIWTKDEYHAFLEAVMDKNASFYAFELLYSGPAFAKASFWLSCLLTSISPRGTLTINKAYARSGGEDIIGPPKTKKS